MTASSISVIVPSFNSSSTILRTLQSLAQQSRPGLIAEVIVADSSTDASARRLLGRAAGGKVRVLDVGERVMPARARNAGAERASGTILAFLDSDAVAAPDWVERIAENVAAGRRVGGGSVSLPAFQRWAAVPEAQWALQFNEFLDAAGAPRSVPFAPSCNLFCERALFERAGGFPAVRASEDVLFGRSVSRLSAFWFVPSIRVEHLFRECPRAFFANQFLLGRYVLHYRRAAAAGRFPWNGAWPAALAPAVAAAKWLRITARLARRPRAFAHYLHALPAFAAGLAAWSAGFARAVFEPMPEEAPRACAAAEHSTTGVLAHA